jgi:hypothetical protein
MDEGQAIDLIDGALSSSNLKLPPPL